MKTTKRFDNAVTKLYNAFHNGTLNAMHCSACAVGNICDNSYAWDYLPDFAASTYFKTNPISLEQEKDCAKEVIKKTGYSVEELVKVEDIFLKECNFTIGSNEQHFNGMIKVVEYLCELDNIPNVMDYTKLFETENNKPKYSLDEN